MSDGGYRKTMKLRAAVADQRLMNQQLRDRNAALDAEVVNLKQGLEAAEERARTDLGMIGRKETFFQVVPVAITSLNLEAVKPFGLSRSEGGLCKNFWALGLLMWMFDRDLQPVADWITKKFVDDESVRMANLTALDCGHAYAETAELAEALPRFRIKKAELPAGEYRGITGSEALSLGIAAAGELADRPLIFCSYPITPASPVLHHLAKLDELGVGTFQAEDEIAAICAAIGASYGGAIGVTSSSGPGIALKTEAIGLAVNAELPLVIVNSQRGGPSTGLPTRPTCCP